MKISFTEKWSHYRLWLKGFTVSRPSGFACGGGHPALVKMPTLRVSDGGLVDVRSFKKVELFV